MKNYQIIIGSPVDYEELVAEIKIKGEYVAVVQQEEGKDKMIVEFIEKKIKTKIYLNDLAQALDDARALLLKESPYK
ncbi:MAG: Dissimilatory sulfite reductase (DsrD) [Flavipsychrobacter sp.]|jgi:16S rRNA C1402 (ribose-2'-O) methylase RsmI|nr:Dissimilatory sulfite reductase (DsrD) [Flavipsychrobacter sp.]